jgi:hypothetical protein
MGKTYTEIDQPLSEFIRAQHVFFVASAPLSGDGRVNLSPKGLDCLRILTPLQIGYIDYSGSGVETIAHTRENGRMTIMFCAFDGPPRILRLYGRGRAVEPQDAEWAQLIPLFAPAGPVRAIILLDVTRIQDSCGFGVPLYRYEGERDQLLLWTQRKGVEGLREYHKQKNATSLDGLPGLRSASADA